VLLHIHFNYLFRSLHSNGEQLQEIQKWINNLLLLYICCINLKKFRCKCKLIFTWGSPRPVHLPRGSWCGSCPPAVWVFAWEGQGANPCAAVAPSECAPAFAADRQRLSEKFLAPLIKLLLLSTCHITSLLYWFARDSSASVSFSLCEGIKFSICVRGQTVTPVSFVTLTIMMCRKTFVWDFLSLWWRWF
jgi:hypothetical protein